MILKQIVNATRLKLLNRVLWNYVVMKKYCVHIFLGVMLFFNLEIKIKYTTKLVGHRNFSKTSQQNFMNLCTCEGQNILERVWSNVRSRSNTYIDNNRINLKLSDTCIMRIYMDNIWLYIKSRGKKLFVCMRICQ